MSGEDKVYRELQRHLDKQAVGFPATKTGVEIRILKEFFSPEEADLALYLNYEPRSVSEICARVQDSGLSDSTIAQMLKDMANNGAIGVKEQDGTYYYYTMPLLIGMLELHAGQASPQFLADFNEYIAGEFGTAFKTTKVSQMRTIPVEQSIPIERAVTTYDHVREIISTTDGPIAIHPCICREGAKRRGEPCHQTTRQETCMTFGDWAQHSIEEGASREITREQALEIIRQNEEDGLVLQPTNYQRIDFICSCCGCCCGVLKIQKSLPKPAENWSHNYHAAVTTDECTACEACVDRCQMNAIAIDETSGYAVVNLDRCFGCGNCVVTCPSGALHLIEQDGATSPPEDRTGLYSLLADRTH